MPTDAELLAGVVVRPVIIPAECRQWDEQMSTWHYLKSAKMVGEQVRYVAEYHGYWVALLGWSAATLKSAPRRAWIGWDVVRERQRLHLIVQNARFLMLPGFRVKNLASRILALNTARLSADWEQAYGHPLFLAETFVDAARFTGTCYRAAGWKELGVTAGCERRHGEWSRHGVKKLVLGKQLCDGALAEMIKPVLPHDRSSLVTPHEIRLTGATGLLDTLRRAIPDPRHRKGRRYRHKTLLGLLVAGMLAGRNEVEHIAAWARGLPERILLRFGCPRRVHDRKVVAPCANSYRYLLQDIDPLALDRAVREWLMSTGISTAGMVIAIDGKTLRGSATMDGEARKVVSMWLHESGITIAQREVPPGTTEVPLAREMLADPQLDFDGSIFTCDAAHTCPETAQVIGKKGRNTSSPSKAINPTWRLRWSNASKPALKARTSPATTITVAMSTAP
jgi:hypothetical protein